MLTIYSTKTCAWCKQVAKYFSMKNVEHETVYIDDDTEMRQKLLDKTGMTAVPVTTDGEEYVLGWNVSALNNLIKSQK